MGTRRFEFPIARLELTLRLIALSQISILSQTQTCLITYLIAKDTADDFIWPIIENKLSVLNQAGLSKDSFTAAMHAVSQTIVSF